MLCTKAEKCGVDSPLTKLDMYYSRTCAAGLQIWLVAASQSLVVYMTLSNYAKGIKMPRIDNTETFKNALDRLEGGLSSSNCGGVEGGKTFAGSNSPLTFQLECSQ